MQIYDANGIDTLHSYYNDAITKASYISVNIRNKKVPATGPSFLNYIFKPLFCHPVKSRSLNSCPQVPARVGIVFKADGLPCKTPQFCQSTKS